MPSASKGTWQFSVNYDLISLQNLKDGTQLLNDNSRERRTHSILTEIGYSLTKGISIDGFFTWVRQERRVVSIVGDENFTHTTGVGDAVLLLKYRPVNILTLGYGVKLPTGSTERENNGIPLSADMQPGSGSWDHIVYSRFTSQMGFRPGLTLQGTFIYRLTGTNESYLSNSAYGFGDDVQLLIGLADRYTINNSFIIDPSLIFRLRKADRDEFEGQGFSSSGGKFIFINPGLSWQIDPKLAYQINIELPLYSNVNEVQLSPTIRINTGLYYSISRNNIEFDLNE